MFAGWPQMFHFPPGIRQASAATVAFDNAANSGNMSNLTSATWTHNTIAGDYLIVGLAGWDSADSLAGVMVTYNGVPMTKLGGQQNAGFNNAVLWGLAAPAAGSHTVSVTNIPASYAELGGGSVSFIGVDQTNPTGTLVSERGGDESIDLTLATGGMGVDILYYGCCGTEPATTGVGQTKRVNQNTTGGTKWHMMSTAPGSGTVALSWTSTTDSAQAGVPLKAATTPYLPPSGTPITGYAWSDTIGWISFNCSDLGTCGSTPYGLYVDASGNVTGYAWSDNIGWVSANESGCPSGTCQPKLIGGTLSGWLKARSGGSAQSGGWDGWISLSGAGYGPTLQPGGYFSGFAWGSDVVGWVDMQYAHTSFSCVPTPGVCAPDPITGVPNSGLDNGCGFSACPYVGYGYMCNPGTNPPSCDQPPAITGTFTVSPKIVRAGNSAQVTWDISNADTCTVTGSNSALWTPDTSGSQPSTITGQTIFLLHCDGAIPGSTYDAQQTVNIAPTFQEI